MIFKLYKNNSQIFKMIKLLIKELNNICILKEEECNKVQAINYIQMLLNKFNKEVKTKIKIKLN